MKLITKESNGDEVQCDECYSYVDEAIELGEEYYFASKTAIICKSCLEKALNLFNK